MLAKKKKKTTGNIDHVAKMITRFREVGGE